MANATTEKIQIFRNFASDLARQVVDQLCAEYEREVSILWNDLVSYRNELGRVAELLGNQLSRERALHEMLDAMAGHNTNLANSVHMAASYSPSHKQLHELLDQIMGQHGSAMSATVSQVHAAAQNQVASARQMQEPLITAENEYSRIMAMLSQPLIPGQVQVSQAVQPPAPTVVGVAQPAEQLTARGSRTPPVPMTPARPGQATPGASVQLPTTTPAQVTYVAGPGVCGGPPMSPPVVGPPVVAGPVHVVTHPTSVVVPQPQGPPMMPFPGRPGGFA